MEDARQRRIDMDAEKYMDRDQPAPPDYLITSKDFRRRDEDDEEKDEGETNGDEDEEEAKEAEEAEEEDDEDDDDDRRVPHSSHTLRIGELWKVQEEDKEEE